MSDSQSTTPSLVAEEIRALKEEIRRLREQLTKTVERMAARSRPPTIAHGVSREHRKRTSDLHSVPGAGNSSDAGNA